MLENTGITEKVSGAPLTAEEFNEINSKLNNAISSLSSHFANVVDYGAKGNYNIDTGIGNDDSDAIQNAVNTGKTVFFPQGTYLVTRTITTPDGIAFSISGKAKSSIHQQTPVIYFNPIADKILFSSMESNSMFKKVVLNGYDKTDGLTLVNASNRDVETKQDVDIKFEDVSFVNFETAINLTGRGLSIDNCTFSQGKDLVKIDWPNPFVATGLPEQSLYMGMRGYIIRNSRIHACSGYLLVNTGYNSINANNIQITNNNIDTEAGFIYGSARDCLVANNVLTQSAQSLFFLPNGCKFENINISNNILNGMSIDSGLFVGIKDIIAASDNTEIKRLVFCANIVNHVSRNIFNVKNAEGIVVSQNIFSNLFNDNVSDGYFRTLFKATGTINNISISGNTINLTNRAFNPEYLINVLDYTKINEYCNYFDSTIMKMTPAYPDGKNIT